MRCARSAQSYTASVMAWMPPHLSMCSCLFFGVHDGAACLEHDGRGFGDLLGLADEVDECVWRGFLRDERLLFAGFHCFLL